MKYKLSYSGAVAVILFALTGCATSPSKTELSNVWMDTSYRSSETRLDKLLIIGLANTLENRRELENKFVDVLLVTGVTGVPSLDVIDADADITKENVYAAIAGRNINAVLLTELVQADESQFYKGSDPSTYWSEKQFYVSVGAYEQARSTPDDLNQITTKFIVLLKISLYEMTKEKFIWSANSLSIDPKSADEVIQSLTELVVKRLRNDNLL